MGRFGAAVALPVTVVVMVAASGCGGDDSGAGGDARGDAGSSATEPADAEAAAIEILVTNDDGYDAEGIDALVETLRAEDGVSITVVAPATQQSGTGGNETPGEMVTRLVTTRSGYEATAVEGFPADSVRVALDDMGLQPDLVISGINEGQNLGPLVDISGTVGAARAAVRAGVPALAVSQGLGSPPDYRTAAELVVDWLDENRAAAAAGDLPADEVINLNVPTCPTGEVRGLVEVDSATDGDPLATPDCTGPADQAAADVAGDDVKAFLDGYATLTEVAPEPAGT